ncbi:MAG: nitrile hydratase subunit alpha [Betaproteobacteria bacterium]|nr:nitrile hydratase subunit alpha [Pseudomonadota bacterium]NBO13354.1 nitrile hydratase subunit alpha [Betaproteobacteria bacterium]NBP11654.1 nitrile hydratase subunit alpha [Betaproteobacteria bacterium]NBP61366.1 nitrile hydratase subunit alpha [Betaproteobacteria bacterium]NBQ09988.1 nitrile hydratase subunit alpha [Betaproteobacteria bacterium]
MNEKPVAAVHERVQAVERLLESASVIKPSEIDEFSKLAQESWIPQNGARLIARAWTDPAFKQHLLQNGKAAAESMGFGMPAHHRHFVVLENTEHVHNVICCSLCSCTAFSIIGLPPDWYKDFEYRSRLVRQARIVLSEMGLRLAADTEIRVWDTTADTRYMVMPRRPSYSEGWGEAELAGIITKDAMIGVASLEP